VAETITGTCSQTNVNVRLDPPGLVFFVGSSTRFRFENIPPGEYVLTVLNRCNPFGCWAKIGVVISSSDVFVTIPILPFCVGDCNRDLSVSIGELISGVNMSRQQVVLFSCAEFDPNKNSAVEANELLMGVRSTLLGCPQTHVIHRPLEER
jgi:hypothetical protein